MSILKKGESMGTYTITFRNQSDVRNFKRLIGVTVLSDSPYSLLVEMSDKTFNSINWKVYNVVNIVRV